MRGGRTKVGGVRAYAALTPAQSWANALAALPEQQPKGDIVALGAIQASTLIELRKILDRNADFQTRVFGAATEPTKRMVRQFARMNRSPNTVINLTAGIDSLRSDDPSTRQGITTITLCAVYGDVGARELRGIDWAADRFAPSALLFLSAGLDRHALARLELDILGERDTKIVDERRPPTPGGHMFVVQRGFSQSFDRSMSAST